MNTSTHTLISDTEDRLEYLKSRQAEHWYVMKLPVTTKNCEAELEAERQRRANVGEKPFEFFAPTYIRMQSGANEGVKQKRYLLYNYVFIYSSVNEIFQIKRRIPNMNFLPRKGEGPNARYPYVSDAEMERFKWIASAYANQIPLLDPSVYQLSRGDHIRIIKGPFAGVEATLVSYNGSGRKDIVVQVEDLLWVPLLHIKADQYELISLNEKSKHLYFQLDSAKYWNGLHTGLCHHYADKVTEADKALAEEVVRTFRNLSVDTDVTQVKKCCLLLMAYTVMGAVKEKSDILGMIETVEPALKAVQAKALLATTLYGCTDNYFYYTRAHAIINPWKEEEKPKKNKTTLLKRLNDYDHWLGH